MHRVELKERFGILRIVRDFVPNAPCGVESDNQLTIQAQYNHQFLMHRVELKETNAQKEMPCLFPFLMHRVELKVIFYMEN